MQFLVKGVSVEPNLRGQDMRRVYLRAVAGDDFKSDQPVSEGQSEAEPDAVISLLLGAKAAKRFAVGDMFTVIFREE